MDERMNEALDQISDRHIAAAAAYRRRRRPWLGAVAAVLVLALCVGLLHSSARIAPLLPTLQGGHPLTLANLIAAPSYPKMPQCPNYQDFDFSDGDTAYVEAVLQWSEARSTQYDQPEGYAHSLTPFFQKTIPQFLTGEGNRAYSPLNVYMALATLAEVTDGSSRQQILDLLGVDTIEQLRIQADHVWNAHYCDDGESTTLLANSAWLDSAFTFDPETALTLAKAYHASVFHGDLGTDELDQQLRQWLDSQTGGVLKEHTAQIQMPDETVFALASTAYFSASWSEKFSKEKTANGTFHCPDFDLETPFMNQSISWDTYYWSDDFGAVRLELDGGSAMWLILPDQGVTVDEVLQSSDYLEMILSPDTWPDQQDLAIDLSLPKFDIGSKIDLCDGLKALGITDIFDPNISDFTPMTKTPEIYASQIEHSVRVAIDEESVVAAAYTVAFAQLTSGRFPLERIDFILDRPFLFAITSHDDLPLFTGVVEQP